MSSIVQVEKVLHCLVYFWLKNVTTFIKSFKFVLFGIHYLLGFRYNKVFLCNNNSHYDLSMIYVNWFVCCFLNLKDIFNIIVPLIKAKNLVSIKNIQ